VRHRSNLRWRTVRSASRPGGGLHRGECVLMKAPGTRHQAPGTAAAACGWYESKARYSRLERDPMDSEDLWRPQAVAGASGFGGPAMALDQEIQVTSPY
jgi:hypothetical protein